MTSYVKQSLDTSKYIGILSSLHSFFPEREREGYLSLPAYTSIPSPPFIFFLCIDDYNVNLYTIIIDHFQRNLFSSSTYPLSLSLSLLVIIIIVTFVSYGLFLSSILPLLLLGEDPFLSPAIAPDNILKRFPPVRMVVGDLDPLLGKFR